MEGSGLVKWRASRTAKSWRDAVVGVVSARELEVALSVGGFDAGPQAVNPAITVRAVTAA